MISREELLNFPEDIRDFMLYEMETLTDGIIQKFALNDEQAMFVFDLDDGVFLKNIDTLQLPNKLDSMPDAKNVDVRLLALDIAYKVLWPLQDYLEGVDRLILRLGGRVPRIRPLRNPIKDAGTLFPGVIEGMVKKIMAQFTDFKELRLTSNKIFNEKDLTVSPTVENWLKDYIHFAGAGEHDSLKRAKYLAEGRNVISLNDKDKESLRCLLVSYDQGSRAYFEIQEGILRVSEVNENKTAIVTEKGEGLSFDKKLEKLHQHIIQIDSSVLGRDFVMSEADNEINKVRDVLWKALGLQDKDKALGCLRILVEKQMLFMMIREDNRFRGILKRFINIKYGREFETILEGDYDKSIIQRIFLEMLLVDKLRLSEAEALAVAFYITNLQENSGQIVYFDKTTSSLRWRELQTIGNKLLWQEQL